MSQLQLLSLPEQIKDWDQVTVSADEVAVAPISIGGPDGAGKKNKNINSS